MSWRRRKNIRRKIRACKMSFDQAFIFVYPWTVLHKDFESYHLLYINHKPQWPFSKELYFRFWNASIFCTNHYMLKCLARSTYLFNDDEMRSSFSLHFSWQNTNRKVCLATCTFSYLWIQYMVFMYV